MIAKVIKASMKANTEYTIIFYTREVTSSLDINIEISGQLVKEISINNNTKYRINITTPSNMTNEYIYFNGLEHTKQIYDIMLLDGNVDAPYFKGMKSVGECEDNKIEILSNNINLFNGEWELGGFNSTNGNPTIEITQFRCVNPIKVEPSTRYSQSSRMVIHYLDKDLKQIGGYNISGALRFDTPSNCHYIKIRSFNADFVNDFKNFKYMLVKGENMPTTHIDGLLNKKEILLNEPLRGLPNGVKDRFVKIDGKWFIERNISKIVLNGTYSEKVRLKQFQTYNDGSERKTVRGTIEIRDFKNLNWGHSHDCLSYTMNDKYLSYRNMVEANEKDEEFCNTWNFRCIVIQINKSKLSSVDETGFNSYLQNSPVEVIYQLETPIYEPLEVEPTLNTYNDITHISTNSTIPCNMKVTNTGYNAIIKPSTQYTVAFDTDKSGEVGINLGGAKVTTTNNVATVTTPSTLTDDSLRLYGKGIKGSKVRLLEGNKTNWIPSHFEGMMSSFEDKFDTTDNTYKMEILSNNKNLFDITKDVILQKRVFKKDRCILSYDEHTTTMEVLSDKISVIFSMWRGLQFSLWLKPNTTYEVSFNKSGDNYSGLVNGKNIKLITTNGLGMGSWMFEPSSNGSMMIEDIMIREINNKTDKYVCYKSNKIQFSSIEPLRSLPSGVKDKFIFKDSKLMIERNTRKTKITSDMNFTRSYEGWANIVFACEVDGLIPIDISTKNVYCNILPSFNIAELCNALGKTGIASHGWVNNKCLQIAIKGIDTVDKLREWISERDVEIVYQTEPIYEEVSFELQKIILEGYENGTLFFDTNIPPTSTVTYAGETPIVKATKLNKTEVLNNTNDINDNIVPYLMDMDFRVVCLQLEGGVENISMARLFGGTYEMLQRDILSNRYSKEEYKYRLDAYLSANKITHEEYTKLGDILND